MRASAWNSPTWDPHFQRFWKLKVELPVQRMGGNAAHRVVQLEGARTNAFSLTQDPTLTSKFLRPSPKQAARGDKQTEADPSITCFNCKGAHNLSVCPYPIDQDRVNKAKAAFAKQRKIAKPEPAPKKKLKSQRRGGGNNDR